MTDADLNALVRDLNQYGKCAKNPGIIADYSEELAIKAADAITTLRAQLAAETDRANRAEAERAAQIEADAGIADAYVEMRDRQIADESEKAAHHVDVPQILRWRAGKIQSEAIADKIRAQPHDRTALIAAIRDARRAGDG